MPYRWPPPSRRPVQASAQGATGWELTPRETKELATKTSAGSHVLVALTYCNYDHPNYLEMARQLIEKGADPNATDFRGRNSFFILCEKNKSVDLLLMLRELIILGVNPSTKENNDRNASEILKSNTPELLSEESYRSLCPVWFSS